MKSARSALLILIVLVSCQKSKSLVGEWRLANETFVNKIDGSKHVMGSIVIGNCAYSFRNDSTYSFTTKFGDYLQSSWTTEGTWAINETGDTLIINGEAQINGEDQHFFKMLGDTLRIYTEDTNTYLSYFDFVRQ